MIGVQNVVHRVMLAAQCCHDKCISNMSTCSGYAIHMGGTVAYSILET